MGQGTLSLADCKGRAFTPLRQQLPARAKHAPKQATVGCAIPRSGQSLVRANLKAPQTSKTQFCALTA